MKAWRRSASIAGLPADTCVSVLSVHSTGEDYVWTFSSPVVDAPNVGGLTVQGESPNTQAIDGDGNLHLTYDDAPDSGNTWVADVGSVTLTFANGQTLCPGQTGQTT